MLMFYLYLLVFLVHAAPAAAIGSASASKQPSCRDFIHQSSPNNFPEIPFLNRIKLNAELTLFRSISIDQARAVEEAHLAGLNEPGADGTPAKANNYTQAQISRKYRILKKAGFSKSDIEYLMENRVVGAAANEFIVSGSPPKKKIDPADAESEAQEEFAKAFNEGGFTESNRYVSVSSAEKVIKGISKYFPSAHSGLLGKIVDLTDTHLVIEYITKDVGLSKGMIPLSNKYIKYFEVSSRARRLLETKGNWRDRRPMDDLLRQPETRRRFSFPWRRNKAVKETTKTIYE